jgi:hypothetical protein
VELRQGEAFLELDRAADHGVTGISVPVHSSVSLGAVRAGYSSKFYNSRREPILQVRGRVAIQMETDAPSPRPCSDDQSGCGH